MKRSSIRFLQALDRELTAEQARALDEVCGAEDEIVEEEVIPPSVDHENGSEDENASPDPQEGTSNPAAACSPKRTAAPSKAESPTARVSRSTSRGQSFLQAIRRPFLRRKDSTDAAVTRQRLAPLLGNVTNAKYGALLDSSMPHIFWSDLEIQSRVGLGGGGQVFRAHQISKNRLVAIKKTWFVDASFEEQDIHCDESIAEFINELVISYSLRHAHILKCYGAILSKNHLCIVYEYCQKGSLYDLFQKEPHALDDRRTIQIALEISMGMEYLHSHTPPILHRDLKSHNILLDENFHVKVCDFGHSRVQANSMTNAVGTIQWNAPELLMRQSHYTKAADVYSFGIVLWELLERRSPTHDEQLSLLRRFAEFRRHSPSKGTNSSIQAENLPADWFRPGTVSPKSPLLQPVVALLDDCLQWDPRSRPSFTTCIRRLKSVFWRGNPDPEAFVVETYE